MYVRRNNQRARIGCNYLKPRLAIFGRDNARKNLSCQFNGIVLIASQLRNRILSLSLQFRESDYHSARALFRSFALYSACVSVKTIVFVFNGCSSLIGVECLARYQELKLRPVSGHGCNFYLEE